MAKRVEIMIDKKGNFTIEKFGYEGAACTANQSLEVALGGELISDKKKPEYYEGDGEQPVRIEF